MYRKLSFILQLVVCILLFDACSDDDNMFTIVNVYDKSVNLVPTKVYPYLDIIYHDYSTLNEEQQGYLDKALGEFFKRDGRYRNMYLRLVDMRVKIKFEINAKELEPLRAKAGFSNGKIMFLDSKSIKIEYLLEEMVHAVQHYDVHGQAKMLSAKKNIEFEAKVLQDIYNITNPPINGFGLLGNFGEPYPFYDEYLSWIHKVANDAQAVLDGFDYFCKKWGGYKGTYDPSFKPLAITKYFIP